MATYDADLVPAPQPITPGGLRLDPKPAGLVSSIGAAPTTYYYRTTGGTRASTTDAGSIPAGAVVERVT